MMGTLMMGKLPEACSDRLCLFCFFFFLSTVNLLRQVLKGFSCVKISRKTTSAEDGNENNVSKL